VHLEEGHLERETSDMSVAYIGPKSGSERPRKTKIGTEVAHVTWLEHHFQGQNVKSQLAGVGAYCGSLPHSLFKIQAQLESINQSGSLYVYWFSQSACINTIL